MDLSCDSDSNSTILQENEIKPDPDLDFDPSKVKDEPSYYGYGENNISDKSHSSPVSDTNNEDYMDNGSGNVPLKLELFNCPSCGKKFEESDFVNTSGVCVKCDIVGKVVPVSFNSGLIASTSEEPEKPLEDIWNCLLCTRRFKSYGNFTKHLLMHEPRCGICTLDFNDEDGLRNHIKQDHAFR